MFESDYYPPGAYSDPNAPYNQCEPELTEVEVDGEVSISLSHDKVPITVEAREVIEEDYDECGSYRNVYDDFTDSNPEKGYEESPYYIIQLLKEYADILKGYKSIAVTNLNKALEADDTNKIKALTKVVNDYTTKIQQCEGWCVDDLNVCI